MKRALVLALILTGPALAASGPAAKFTLQPSYGGAVVDGRVYVPKPDTLVGAWSGKGFARLMKCSPLCRVVTSIPLKGTTVMNGESGYRIALGGHFAVGQKVPVTLRFQSGALLITVAVVNR